MTLQQLKKYSGSISIEGEGKSERIELSPSNPKKNKSISNSSKIKFSQKIPLLSTPLSKERGNSVSSKKRHWTRRVDWTLNGYAIFCVAAWLYFLQSLAPFFPEMYAHGEDSWMGLIGAILFLIESLLYFVGNQYLYLTYIYSLRINIMFYISFSIFPFLP